MIFDIRMQFSIAGVASNQWRCIVAKRMQIYQPSLFCTYAKYIFCILNPRASCGTRSKTNNSIEYKVCIHERYFEADGVKNTLLF